MKKLITKALAILILLTTFNIPVVSAEFIDISVSHKNYDAIIYLQQNDIIHGYPDGTFRPYNQVNRAEFLKIILEGSNIPLDLTTNTPFPDVNHTAWYGPYIKKAYATGWIDGYPDGTFKPEQTINKAEALKILGEVQDWAAPDPPSEKPFEDTPKFAWYTKYVAYAKDHSYLEETGTIFFPDTPMTRANISEIIYRTLVIGYEQDDTDPSPTDPDDEEPEEITFTPVTYGSIPEDFYDKISLDESLPNTFYKNEVYVIKGEVTSGSYTKAAILLDSSQGSDQTIFAGDVKNNEFEIPVYFTESGNYYLGIIPGEAGETKTKKISVFPSLPESSEEETLTSTAQSLSIDFADDKTFVEFSAPSSTIKKLYFIQDNESATYISRQNIDSINVNYSDFEEFEEGEVSYYIKTAKLSSQKPLTLSSNFTTSSSKKFNAVEHTYDSISEDVSSSPPDRLASVQPISFIGSLNADTQTRAYVIKPNGFVDKITLSTISSTTTYFGNTIILSGSDFQFEYSPSSTGQYIIEIIDKDGLPLINHPVYIGSIIPLIPDYFDLHERELFTRTFNLENLREYLLQKINESRSDHGLEEVIMSEELNQIAQAHSNDMATNDFFSHINPNGQTPEDRRIAASITTPVSENIAMDVSIIFGHLGLMRSASHRDNILSEDWTRVGLGISLDEGYLFITEEFSTSELSQADLESFKNNLFSEINTKRIDNSATSLTYDNSLEMASIYLNNKVIQEGASLTNSIFQEALETYSITGASQAIGRTYNLWSKILSSILEEETAIIEAVWRKIGIDIQTDSTGNIHTILILN